MGIYSTINTAMGLGKLSVFALLFVSTFAQQQQQAQFRQNQEPQFQPPPPNAPVSGQFNTNFQQQQQPVAQGRQNQGFPQSAQPQQQNFFPQSAQQTQQASFQQQQPQPNFQDFAAFNNRQQQEVLPTLPPVFIPPNNPVGAPPQLQSPIRNLFRQPENSFSLSNIFSRFLNLFNLNNN